MNFQTLPPVPQEKQLIDIAFHKASIRQKNKSQKKGTWMQQIQRTEASKLDLIRDVLVSHLEKVLKDFPQTEALPSFYQHLLRLTLDVRQLKKSLAALSWCMRKISLFHREYVHRVMQEKDPRGMNQLSRQYYGRIASLVKQISPELRYLENSRKIMKTYPDVKEMFTVCIYGFPNVGKSTLLNKLTGTRAEVAPYAFTTKSINVGYLHLEDGTERGKKEEKEESRKKQIQIVDVPGTLARKEKMNLIEQQADLVVRELAQVVVYVFDYSDTSGYELAEQEKLFDDIRKKKTVLVYLAKRDITSKEILDKAKEGLTLEELKKEIIQRNSTEHLLILE